MNSVLPNRKVIKMHGTKNCSNSNSHLNDDRVQWWASALSIFLFRTQVEGNSININLCIICIQPDHLLCHGFIETN